MSIPLRFTAYYGMRRYLLLAPTFILDPPNPYRPYSPTLLLACKEPFHIEWRDGSSFSGRAAVVAAKVARRRLVAVNSDLAIFCLPLQSKLDTDLVEPLDFERFSPLMSDLAEAFPGKLPAAGVDRLFDAAMQIISGTVPVPPPLDPRIEKALQLIDELPFDEAKLPALSRRLNLSPSRLRHLFKEVTGHSVSHYARWAAVWRAVSQWSQGRRLTEVAHEVGFHDLAHLDHAFIEVFGLNPSMVINPENVTLIRCP